MAAKAGIQASVLQVGNDRDEQVEVPIGGAALSHAVLCLRKAVMTHLRHSLMSWSAEPARCERGILAYVVDVQVVAERVDADLVRYRYAMALIVEDEVVQGGAATFRGTRILVHQVAALLAQGATEAELREDYPRLTPEMIAAAPIYARAHPRRGRPRKPAWREKSTAQGNDEKAGGSARA